MKFTEQITELWNNNEMDNETKLATLLDMTKNYVPKARVDEYAKRVSSLETEKEQLSTEYEEFKKSKMTDDEKREAELKQFEADKKANAIEKSALAVKSLLLDNGIKVTDSDDDKELRDTLETIISEDYDKSVKLANSFISLLNKTKDNTAKETTTQLLNNTPKPIGGVDSSSTVSKVDELKSQLDKAIENKNSVEQIRLMREIQEEQAKQQI